MFGGFVGVGCNESGTRDGDAATSVASPSKVLASATPAALDVTPTSNTSVPEFCFPQSPHGLSIGHEPFCVTWVDRFSGEMGFVIRLTYLGSGETFQHTVGANVTEFVFPPGEDPFAAPPDVCASHGAFEVVLSAMRDGKTEEFDRVLTYLECGRG